MKGLRSQTRPALRLIESSPQGEPVEWVWFCGHCASSALPTEAPAPVARVCSSCGLGVMLETRSDLAPCDRDAFLVVDASLMVQGVSARAEQLLAIEEERAINRPVRELLVAPDAEAGGPGSFAGAIADAVAGGGEPVSKVVRPWNTFGVRVRARIGSCGPPRAALVVLEATPSRVRAVRNH